MILLKLGNFGEKMLCSSFNIRCLSQSQHISMALGKGSCLTDQERWGGGGYVLQEAVGSCSTV